METNSSVRLRRPIDSGISVGDDEKMENHSDSADDDIVFKDAEHNMKTEDNKEDVKSEQKSQAAEAVGAVKESILSSVNQVKFSLKYFSFALVIWLIGYFGFSILWIAIGVSIFVWREHKRKSKEITTQILDRIANDERKYFQTVKDIYKMSGRDLPSWVYFPDVEKAEWLNKILKQVWPYVGDYVKKIIVEKVEPSICESNKLLKGFKFSKVDLGEKSPRVAGIKVYGDGQTRRTEIVMDVQIIYDSFCNIGVTINKLNAGIKNLSVRGVLRVEMRPLVDTIPLVGAVSVAFVNPPNIEFDLTDLGNLFDIPLIDSALRSSISDLVSKLLVLPEKYVLRLCDDITIKELLHPLPKGAVRVHIIEARNLEEKDRKILGIGGGSDPYVEVKVGTEDTFTTRIIEHNIHPKWNESFDAIVSNIHTSTIEITLYDDDGALNKADYLGSASIQMKSVYNQGLIDEWIPLSNVKHGAIHVRIEWLELSDDPKDLTQAMEHAGKYDLNAALLDVFVDSAIELPGFNQSRYEPNPQVRVILPGHAKPFKTKVIPHSNNPIWEENFRELIQNPRMESLIFKVRSSKNISLGKLLGQVRKLSRRGAEDSASSEDCLGTLKVRLQQLLKSPNMTRDEPFPLMDSGPDSKLRLHLTMRLLKPKGKVVEDTHMSSSFVVADRTRSSVKSAEHSETEKEKNDEIPPMENENHADDPKSSDEESKELSDKSSTSDFGINFGNSPVSKSSSFHDSELHRNPSISSETSNIMEVKNLKERLNNKFADNNNQDGKKYPLGRINITLSYSPEKEKLRIDVHKAENLIVCDEDNNTSDPYVRIYILPHKKSNSRRKTKVVKNNLNPVFDERLEYSFLKDELKEHQLDISIKNKTGLLSSEKVLMGQVRIDLATINLELPVNDWYALKINAEGSD